MVRPEGMERWMVNLTNLSMSQSQEGVLKLGLNFAPAPRRLPLVDMIAEVEEGSHQLKDEEAANLRGHVCGVLQ